MGKYDASSWTDLWAECTQKLGDSDEARHIIEHASGRRGASWLITMNTQAPSNAAERVNEMLRRRLAGEPLQYVVGRWGFRELSLKIDRRVLIPRPETEQVVDAALALCAQMQNPIVVDLGTGSGAIALSIATENRQALVYATDASAGAIEVAESNMHELPHPVQERVYFAQGSWYEALPPEAEGRCDLIVSNPPYIGENERPTLDSQVVDWEPPEALFSGPDGLDALTLIIRDAPRWLTPRGALVVEIAPQQAQRVQHLAREAGFTSVSIGIDLANRERWLVAKK